MAFKRKKKLLGAALGSGGAKGLAHLGVLQALEEVGEELAKMNVAMLATEPDFWDERYYPLSTLADYLEALPADQIVETEDMRLYLLDRSLIPYALAAKD